MNIEKEIFKRSSPNIEKIKKYGFIKIDNYYYFEKNILDDDFKVIVIININNNINSKVIDLQTNEEFINIKIDNQNGIFVNKVKNEYKKILNDIKNNCFDINYFIFDQSNRISNYINNKYSCIPEFLWDKFKGYGVFRNKLNNKWFSIIMNIDKSKIDKENGEIEILNVKLEENIVNQLLKQNGYYKAYHMNKKDWVSIILDDTLDDETIMSLVDKSYLLISKK